MEKKDVLPDVVPGEGEVKDHAPDPNPSPESKGSKTPSENLYAALEEERRLRKEAEAKAADEATKRRAAEEALSKGEVPPSDDGFSDEGRHIVEKIVKPLQDKVTSLESELTLRNAYEKNPALKGHESEFEAFRAARQGYTLEDVTKLFISENNLGTQKRRGLENPRGGERSPAPSEMSTTDVENLMKNDYPRYMKLLQEGKIKLSGND